MAFSSSCAATIARAASPFPSAFRLGTTSFRRPSTDQWLRRFVRIASIYLLSFVSASVWWNLPRRIGSSMARTYGVSSSGE